MGRLSRQSTEATKAFADHLSDLIADEKRCGKSHEDICEGAGVASGAMSDWAADNKTATIDSLYKIAKYFGVSTDWLLGLSNYTEDAARQITLFELGFSETSANQIASIAGAVSAASELGEQANKKVSTVNNPHGFTYQDEARAFLALNVLLGNPDFILALSNAWAYMKYSGQFDRRESMTVGCGDLPEPFSAPCGVLVDALWNRVAEPLRGILDDMAQEVKHGTRKLDIPDQQEK